MLWINNSATPRTQMRPISSGMAKGKESRNVKEKSRDLHGAEKNDRNKRQKTISPVTELKHTRELLK